ncbi:MAG: lasso peptide biosynthesis PqqD family chaperone [Bacteroidales bacterium]|nr:lasso peptide biosynthesis PqqD family chaperone [Bacteroidales bacterium]
MGLLAKKKEIGPDTIIQRRNDLLFNEIDGEVVMLSIETGEYYGMDKVGSYIWKIIDTPVKFRDLIDKLMNQYNVPKELCTNDTSRFLNKLKEKKLLHCK